MSHINKLHLNKNKYLNGHLEVLAEIYLITCSFNTTVLRFDYNHNSGSKPVTCLFQNFAIRFSARS